jgi:hypothetical protein
MTQPEKDTARDIGSPFRVFSPTDRHELFDLDFHPQVVRADEIHPSEVQDDPKDEALSSALESAEGSSTGETSLSLDGLESSALAEKEPLPGLEDLDPPSTDGTSPGDSELPAVTPPLPPAKTPSSRSAGKSS